MKNNENTLFTPANVVTMLRIIGVPIFVVALLSPWPAWFGSHEILELAKPWVSVLIFILLACTDSLDGYLARSRNEVTTFGKFMDPLADKILVCAALLAMIELNFIPSWVALVILTREFIVSGLRMIAASSGHVIAASWYGKAKTVFQIIAIILFLLKGICITSWNTPTHPMYIISWIVMSVALLLTIMSLIDYFIKCMPMLGLSKTNNDEQALEMAQKEKCIERGDIEILGDDDINSRAKEVISELSKRSLRMCTAESLTGGMICELLTAVPGSSSVVRGGAVTYAIETKANILGVDKKLLDCVGAVDSEVAAQMACGARKLNEADICVSVTGIAGPGGAEDGKPVGTVYMGIATCRSCKTYLYHFSGLRDEVRIKTCISAFNEILSTIE